MTYATIAVLLSVQFSLFYLIFYSMSYETEKALRRLDYNFLYFAVYVLFIVFIIAEMSPYPVQVSIFGIETTRMEFLVYFTLAVYFVVLIMI